MIVIAFFAYAYFTGDDLEDTSLLQVTGPQESEVLAQEIRKAISRIDSIKLDTSVFNDPVFQNLIDYSRDIESEPIGHSNPFSNLISAENIVNTVPEDTVN